MFNDSKINIVYHTPYEYLLYCLITLDSATLSKCRIVLDDVDALGIVRGAEEHPFAIVDKVYYDRSQRSNVRPLSINFPRYSITGFRNNVWSFLGDHIPLNKIFNTINSQRTVSELLSVFSEEFALRCWVGPYRATAYTKCDKHYCTVFAFLRDTCFRFIESIIDTPLNSLQKERFDILFTLPELGETVTGHFLRVIRRICEYLKTGIEVVSYAEALEQKKWCTDSHMASFRSNEQISQYNRAATIQGSKIITKDVLPYFAIERNSGIRNKVTKDNIDFFVNNSHRYTICPKVLLMTEFKHQLFPYFARDSNSLKARSLMLDSLGVSHSFAFTKNCGFDLLKQYHWSWKIHSKEKWIWGNCTMDTDKFSDVFDASWNEVTSFEHGSTKLDSAKALDSLAAAFRVETLRNIRDFNYPWLLFIMFGKMTHNHQFIEG